MNLLRRIVALIRSLFGSPREPWSPASASGREYAHAGIRLTAESAEVIRGIVRKYAIGTSAVVRIDLEPVGGGHFHYSMGFDQEFDSEADWCGECYGVRAVCPRKKLPQLNGTVIRFEDGPDQRGFRFDNPNDASSRRSR